MIGVLIIEDDDVATEALTDYIERLPRFAVAGHARTGVEALHRLGASTVDLVLLDIYLPDMSGIEFLRRLRGAGNTVDVMAVTRARDLAVIQAAVSYGVNQYIVKPFTFNSVRLRLERYEIYRARTGDQGLLFAQQDIDHLLGELRDARKGGMPKGVSRESFHAVAAAVRGHSGEGGVSAAEVASILGTSRVTARRYLEYLVDAGLARRRARYHRTGRPELEYTWAESIAGEPGDRP